MNDAKLSSQKGKIDLKIILVVLLLVLIAGLIGWRLGHSNKGSDKTSVTNSSSSSESAASTADVKSLVTYTLPEGWKEATCTSQANTVFIVPSGASLHCDTASIAPIKLSVDSQNTTDCQELSNVHDVRKHICKSLYIGGHKSLQALTEYPKSPTYPADTTISDYYIDTGKGAIRVRYTYTASNDYQIGFDELANSVKVNP